MKKLPGLIICFFPVLLSAQVIRQTKPVTNTSTQIPRQVKTDTVPVRTVTQSPTIISNRPVKSISAVKLVTDLLPGQNLKWYTYDQVSGIDVNPIVYGYTYYNGEKKYDINGGQTPQWKSDFVWVHVPKGAVSAKVEISTLPFPLTDEKGFTGVVDTRIIQRSQPDSVKFNISYKEKEAAAPGQIRAKAFPLIKKTGSMQYTNSNLLFDAFKNYGNYYVRLTPLDVTGKQIGMPGRAVKIVADWINFPKPPVPSSEDSLMSDYEITSVKYIQMHYPEQQYANCTVVTGYNDVITYDPMGHTWQAEMINTFKNAFPVGTILCPSPPSEKSWYEKAFNSVTDAAQIAVNGASKVYNETKGYLKNKFSEYMCNYDPVVSGNKKLLEQSGVDKKTIDDGCNTATGIVFETAMTYAGMPPSIPNFDEMCKMAKGQLLELMIQKAAEQTGMPCDETCKQLIMDGFDKMVEESAAKNVQNGGFFNYKPDPRGQYRLPYVEIEITRKRSTQKGTSIITNLSFTPGVDKIFNLKDNKGQSYTKTINSYDLYEKIQLPVPYLKSVGDKIKLVAMLTPKFAYANFSCGDGRLNNIATHQSFCGGINVVETGEDPKNSSGYSMMVENAAINVNPAGKIKLASGVNINFLHHQ